MTKNMKKVKEQNEFLAQSLDWKDLPSETPGPGTRGKVLSKEGFSLVEVDWIKEHLEKVCIQKSMGPDGMGP